MPDCNASLAAAAGPPLDISPVAVAAPASEEAWLGVGLGVGVGDRNRVGAGFSLTLTHLRSSAPPETTALEMLVEALPQLDPAHLVRVRIRVRVKA